MKLHREGGEPAGNGRSVETKKPVVGIPDVPLESSPSSPTSSPLLPPLPLVVCPPPSLMEVVTEGHATCGTDSVLLKPRPQTHPNSKTRETSLRLCNTFVKYLIKHRNKTLDINKYNTMLNTEARAILNRSDLKL